MALVTSQRCMSVQSVFQSDDEDTGTGGREGNASSARDAFAHQSQKSARSILATPGPSWVPAFREASRVVNWSSAVPLNTGWKKNSLLPFALPRCRTPATLLSFALPEVEPPEVQQHAESTEYPGKDFGTENPQIWGDLELMHSYHVAKQQVHALEEQVKSALKEVAVARTETNNKRTEMEFVVAAKKKELRDVAREMDLVAEHREFLELTLEDVKERKEMENFLLELEMEKDDEDTTLGDVNIEIDEVEREMAALRAGLKDLERELSHWKMIVDELQKVTTNPLIQQISRLMDDPETQWHLGWEVLQPLLKEVCCMLSRSLGWGNSVYVMQLGSIQPFPNSSQQLADWREQFYPPEDTSTLDTVYCATCMTEPFLEGVRLPPEVGIVRSTCFGQLQEINIFDIDKAPPELHIVPNPNPNLPWGGALTGDTGGVATGRLERSMSLHPSSPSRGAHHHSPPRRKLLSRTKSLSRSLSISHPVRTPLGLSSSDSSRSVANGAAGGAFIAVPITLNNICMAVLCVDTLNRPAVLKSMTPRRLTKIHKVAEVLKRAFQMVESAIEKWELEEARLKEDELPPTWSTVQEELSQLQLFQLKLERALQKPEVKMQLFEIDSYTHPPGKLLEMWLAVFGLVDMEGYGGPIVDWIRRLSITKLEDRKRVWTQLRRNIHNVSNSTGNKSILEYLLLAPMEDNPATGFVLKDAYRLADRLLRDMTKKDALRISRSAALLYDWVRTRQKLQKLLREIEREEEQGLKSSLTLKVIKAQAQELSKSLVQSLHHEPGREHRLTGFDPNELDDVAKEDLAKFEAELQQTPMEMRTKKEMQFYFGFNLWMLKSSSPFTFGHTRKRSQPRKTLQFSYPGPIGMRDISDAETSPTILSVHRKSARKPHSSSVAASSGKVSASAKSWSKVAKFAKSTMVGSKMRTSRAMDHPPLNASLD